MKEYLYFIKYKSYYIYIIIYILHIIMGGIRFFDKDGKIIYESAYKNVFPASWIKQHEILLNDGERIVGF